MKIILYGDGHCIATYVILLINLSLPNYTLPNVTIYIPLLPQLLLLSCMNSPPLPSSYYPPRLNFYSPPPLVHGSFTHHPHFSSYTPFEANILLVSPNFHPITKDAHTAFVSPSCPSHRTLSASTCRSLTLMSESAPTAHTSCIHKVFVSPLPIAYVPY